jgi:hypothetical protein
MPQPFVPFGAPTFAFDIPRLAHVLRPRVAVSLCRSIIKYMLIIYAYTVLYILYAYYCIYVSAMFRPCPCHASAMLLTCYVQLDYRSSFGFKLISIAMPSHFWSRALLQFAGLGRQLLGPRLAQAPVRMRVAQAHTCIRLGTCTHAHHPYYTHHVCVCVSVCVCMYVYMCVCVCVCVCVK